MALEIAAGTVSFGMQGDDVARVQQALQALGRDIPLSESEARVLGPGTSAVVRALQQELDLTPTGTVDAATVRAINALLDRLQTAPRVVRGMVRDADGSPFDRGFVQISAQRPDGEQALGWSSLQNGVYQISFELPAERNGQVDLRVALLNDDGLVETTPSGTSILPNAEQLEVVDFVLSGERHLPRPEYGLLMDDLVPLIGERDIAELTEDATRRDVSLLASQSGHSTDQVAAAVLAHRLANETGTPAPVFYGLLRQGLPADAAALHAVHPAERSKALQAALERGLVPETLAGKKLEEYLADFTPALPAAVQELRPLLGRILNVDELAILAREYFANSQEPEVFWEKIAADPILGQRAGQLKLVAQVAGAVNGHAPLVAGLLQQHGLEQASDLARLDADQWRTLVQAEGVGVPADTPGSTPEEKTNAYVEQILARVEAAFPTRFFAARLPDSRVKRFLEGNAYDLRTTYPEQYFNEHADASQPLTTQDRQQLRSFQRVYRLTGSATETLGLSNRGIHSSQQIARMDPTVFAERHKEVLSSERAGAIHRRARRAHAAALAIFGEHAADLNRTGLQALPKLDGGRQADLAASSIPDWQTLFGTFDLCACQDCASVHGPAAYLVDILAFLRDRVGTTCSGPHASNPTVPAAPAVSVTLGGVTATAALTFPPGTTLPSAQPLSAIAPVLHSAIRGAVPNSAAFNDATVSVAGNRLVVSPGPSAPGNRFTFANAGTNAAATALRLTAAAGADTPSTLDILFARRPDLGDVELSCENSNTPLPLVDLVNEVLENAVAPPSPFAPSTLGAALEADLAQPVATPALAAAFAPPLRSGAHVETVEAGARWRIWDEPFAYTVVKDGSDLNVVARSLQTSGSAAERRATPQYRNVEAYAELSRAVYPWALPFDLPREEAAVFLTHLGAPRHELIEALQPISAPINPSAPVAVRLATERLGLSDAERRILVGEPLTPPRQPEEFWDGAPVAQLASVHELLKRSRLSYAELEALVETWFVNPDGALKIQAKPGEPGAPIDTCDVSQLEVSGITAEVLQRLHRFVRLWRALGWTLRDLDRALRALAPNSAAPSLNNALLVRLDHFASLRGELRLSVTEALALWGSIDTAEPHSLYRTLFYNPAVFKPQDDVFRLRSNGTELANANRRLADQAGALQAAFRLRPDALAALVARTNGKLNLANLSFVYRHALLARQLGLSVQDLVTAVELTGLNPFAKSKSHEGPRFVNVVHAVRSSGLGWQQLDYLLRHRSSPAARFVPQESALAQTLAGLRSDLLAVTAPSDAERQQLQRIAVIDRLSAALGLPVDQTDLLLSRVTHAGEPAMQRFLELPGVTAETLSRTDAGPQFDTLEKLLKIASIVQSLELTGGQVEWLLQEPGWRALAPDPSAVDMPFATWYPLIEFQQLRRELGLQGAASEATFRALSAVASANGQAAQVAARRAFVDTLAQWLSWPVDSLETLVGSASNAADLGLLKARLSEDYRISLLVRLSRAISLLKRLGVTTSEASQWCDAVITDGHAKAIRAAAKAKHDEGTWQQLAVQLQDSLRDKQRDALVSYLVARPQLWDGHADRADAHALYAHFLIDVEMSACQLSSRVKQAIGSVQVYAQRCLMGLEAGVTTDDPKWSQWAWMKSFRVWEANRKIWLYPDNWIEADLRDNKTPFFKALENELLQSNLTNELAEQALQHYLEKLDEVSRLETVGIYEDDETRDLYVFGRTIHTPHTYYFRRRDGATKAWLPWERIEVDVEGDHLIPVVWNRKRMVIWPVFTEKTEKRPVKMPQPGQNLEEAGRYWELQLAWSEYQAGRWSGKSLSEPVTVRAYQGEDLVLFGPLELPQLVSTMMARPVGSGGQPDPPSGGGGGPVHPFPPGLGPTSRSLQPVSPEQFSFKALVRGDTLVVRAFLRRDYRQVPTEVDREIACGLGEFRFLGCRKLVLTAHRGQMGGLNMPLAPSGTKFDHMWFTATSGTSLTLFDGSFPIGSTKPIHETTVLSLTNEWQSIASDPSPTLGNRLNIPVLGGSAGSLRLLAPHQDLQFTCDRPFVVMDTSRSFLGTSTGSSRKSTVPQRGDWVRGDLTAAWRADFFPAPAPASEGPTTPSSSTNGPLQPFTVLVRGERGRVATELPPVNLQPAIRQRTLLQSFRTTREYRFANFHHPYLCEFVKILSRGGIPELLSLETQQLADPQSFSAYEPQPRVLTPHPIEEVDFRAGGAYELYNWELFFHVPLLIASHLSRNQRFEEAQRWFHFIFDPTGPSGERAPQRYWRTRPFYERLAADYEAESVKRIEEIVARGLSPELEATIAVWRSNPFNPHAVARLRTTAYQKAVVMKYIDNLIAWGDQLFRRETLESINEATQLFVLAADILGPRPEVIDRDIRPPVQTFNTLDQIGPLGNALEQIELLISDTGDADADEADSEAPDPPSAQVLYFCVPENDKLLGYWSTVGDRLFKIRHCMNIEGQVRQLPLFEPPIDPALLVRAQAAGLSIGEVLSDISVSLPNYRFSVMLQNANELTAEVRNLGQGLLSAVEKRDAEALSILRSGQEVRLLQAMRDVRARQVEEAEANIAALEKSREMAQARKAYYEDRELTNLWEESGLTLTAATLLQLGVKSGADAISIPLSLLPDVKAGTPTTVGFTIGGQQRSASGEAHRSLLQTLADLSGVGASIANTVATYVRRKEEWDHQANLATIELKQLDQQLAAATIRKAVSEQELRNHDQQIENGRETDEFLHSKFTNQELYQSMVGQVSGLYFQSYQLAYDIAKRAEKCMRHELGIAADHPSIIRFGHWDSLRKGLLAGEHLAHDLRRLEIAYLDGNVREFELTKHVSLALLDPLALVQLRETGRGDIRLPEEIFDLDYPGHYFRRIKSVSLTLPCVAGPYTTIACTLRLLQNSVRINTVDGGTSYPQSGPDDPRFVVSSIPDTARTIATSGGQNDSGVFELNFRDERYLPFEGAGAISEWSLELFSDPTAADFGRELRQFDYDTISDVVLHLKYTAREGPATLKSSAVAHLREHFKESDATPAVLMLNLRRDFPTQWSRFLNPTNPADGNVFELDVSPTLFPARDTGKTLTINTISLLGRCTDPGKYNVILTPSLPVPPSAEVITMALERSVRFGGLHLGLREGANAAEIPPTGAPPTWRIRLTRPDGGDLTHDPVTNMPEVQDLMLVLGYAWE